MTDDNPFHLFNTKTMSGIHPGSRTAQAHIVRLQSRTDGQSDGQSAPGWARILWPGEAGDAEVYWLKDGRGWDEQPALRLSGVNGAKPVDEVIGALTAAGQPPLVCGTCRWWQPIADAANPDGIPLGLCSWVEERASVPVSENREQSALALECPHWQAGEQMPAAPVLESVQAEPIGWWAGLKSRLSGQKSQQPAASAGDIAERSGVGAGTERCLACHGRIANLGALTVATESDDKRTLSVWRCRLCHTFYLNDWVDRWERLDSLETEESYYRIAPGEALALLALFRQTSGSEHPKERHSRGAQRAQVDAFLVGRPRLLHQIKLGR
jgi:hypothetical protein